MRFYIILAVLLHSIIGQSNSQGECRLKDEPLPSAKHLLYNNKDRIEESLNRSSCLRVASLELHRIFGDNCQATTELNLETYEKAAEIAGQHGARMLLFPEDGIMYAPRDQLVSCIEEIPDPEMLSIEEAVPCLAPSIYKNSMPVLSRLSCMARQNSIFIIANYGTKQSCDPDTIVGEDKCPAVGFFMLNTNVVFDPQGKFIKRYRKYNIFSATELFDKAPNLEYTYFDTQYGRFGLFTCFDLIFKQPAVDLVEKFKIDTVLFPTWWFDELPILTAIQYQDGWSWKNNVNMISANILRPLFGSIGSAIFTNDNLLNTGSKNDRTRLLIANIAKPGFANDCDSDGGFQPKLIDVSQHSISDSYAHWNTVILKNDSVLFLDDNEHKQTTCSGSVCCTIEYDFRQIESSRNKNLILIVRDSPRAGFYGWYEQFCVLATIDNSKLNKTGSGHNYDGLVYEDKPAFKFLKLSIQLSSQTKYMYPFAATDVRSLIDRRLRDFKCYDQQTQPTCSQTDPFGDSARVNSTCEHSLIIDKVGTELPVYSFGIYGRRYESDVKPKEKVVPRGHHIPGSE